MKPNRPGFADDAAKRATQGYRNGNAVATFPAFSQSRPTRESQWAFSVAARQNSKIMQSALEAGAKMAKCQKHRHYVDTRQSSRAIRMMTETDST